MTTVSELIEYLKDLPGETEVFVIENCHEYTRRAPLNLDAIEGNAEYCDYANSPFLKEGSAFFNKKHLILGEE